MASTKKLKPPPRMKFEKRKSNPAATKKLQQIATQLADGDAPVMPLVQELLAISAKTPYVNGEWQRSIAELDALDALIERKELDPARHLWVRIAKQWAEDAPIAGHGYWLKLARAQQVLDAPLPAAAAPKRAIAHAWALAVVSGGFEYIDDKLSTKAPKDGSDAWRQTCIAITQQNFEAARAALTAMTAWYDGKILEVMLRREQGDKEGAIAAFREHFAAALKRSRKTNWNEVAGLYILIGMDDEDVVDQMLPYWRKDKDKTQPEFFRSVMQG